MKPAHSVRYELTASCLERRQWCIERAIEIDNEQRNYWNINGIIAVAKQIEGYLTGPEEEEK